MQTTKWIVAVAAVTVLAAPAVTSAADAKKQAATSGEADFVTHAAVGNLAEVKAGEVAKQRASNAQVKQFAEQMVRDHTQANDELKQIAQKNGLQVPTDTDERHKKEMEKLSKLSGAEFDKAYMQSQLVDHHETIALFQRQAQEGSNPDLKSFAAKTLPKLEQHAAHAQQLGRQVGVDIDTFKGDARDTSRTGGGSEDAARGGAQR